MRKLSWVMGLVLAGCTVSNPGYQPPDGHGPGKDLGRVEGTSSADLGKLDIGVKRDRTRDVRPFDVAPWPDSMPWQCKGPADCDDKLDCTVDTCNGLKQCEHLQAPNTCLINGACYNANASNAAQSCEACVPGTSTSSFTARGDNVPCASDGLACTADVCKSGACTHGLSTGCLINGACYAESQTVGGDVCYECVSSKSKTSSTFVAGKACASSSGAGAMCLQSKCMSWQETLFEAPSPLPILMTTVLHGVDYIPAAKEVWAVGEYSAPGLGAGGVLVPLTPAATKALTTLTRLRAISYRLAVGDGGQAHYHDGTKWTPESSIQTALNGADRVAVWGSSVSAADTFYLAGLQTSPGAGAPGVLACTQAATGFACTEHDAFPQNTLLGGIFGTVTGTGGQGPLWAARFGANSPEDIYFNIGSGTSWTTNGPEGCLDTSGGTTPCSSTSSDVRHMFGSSGADIWVVGTTGMVLRYDGLKWSKAGPPSSATNYTLDAVYSSPADKLVTIPAHRDLGTGRVVALYNYNSDLNRWFGPIVLAQTVGSWSDEVRDIGGQGASNLWMVGQRQAGLPPRTQGWILQLK
jgi:hypothetical protein